MKSILRAHGEGCGPTSSELLTSCSCLPPSLHFHFNQICTCHLLCLIVNSWSSWRKGCGLLPSTSLSPESTWQVSVLHQWLTVRASAQGAGREEGTLSAGAGLAVNPTRRSPIRPLLFSSDSFPSAPALDIPAHFLALWQSGEILAENPASQHRPVSALLRGYWAFQTHGADPPQSSLQLQINGTDSRGKHRPRLPQRQLMSKRERRMSD